MTYEQSQQPRPEENPSHPERQTAEEPQIWAGSLLDYNNGILHGAWMSAAREATDLHADIQIMLDASPMAATTGQVAEEWGIFDADGFGQANIGEYEDLDVVSALARGISEHGLAFAAWAATRNNELESLEKFADVYQGHYSSVTDFVEQLLDDLGYTQMLDKTIPESLRLYIAFDIEALARDMEMAGEIVFMPADDNGVWIFDSNL